MTGRRGRNRRKKRNNSRNNWKKKEQEDENHGLLVGERRMKQNDESQKLLLKRDDDKGNDEEMEDVNTKKQTRTDCLSNSLELGNTADQAKSCPISAYLDTKENDPYQYRGTDETEDDRDKISQSNANGENVSDSAPYFSESDNTFAQEKAIVISAREYLDDKSSDLYLETDESEESNEESEETAAREPKTKDSFSDSIRSSYEFAQSTRGESSETNVNDIKTNGNEITCNIIFCLPEAVDSVCEIDQTTIYSITAKEYLTENIVLETIESEEDEEETTEITVDDTLSGVPSSSESNNPLSDENKCIIPLCEYLEEIDQNSHSEMGKSEENKEEIKQADASEYNLIDILPDLFDSGIVFVQNYMTTTSCSEFIEVNDRHLLYDEKHETIPQLLHLALQLASDPLMQTQQIDRDTDAEHITLRLYNAIHSEPSKYRENNVMSVDEYLNDDNNNLLSKMTECEETEDTNSNEEISSESSIPVATENKCASPAGKNLENDYEELCSNTEECTEIDEKPGEENDEETEEENSASPNYNEGNRSSLDASSRHTPTNGLATDYTISIREFLMENERNLLSESDDDEDVGEEMNETDSNSGNVSGVLNDLSSSDNTVVADDSAPISDREYLNENVRNMCSDKNVREENEDDRQEMNDNEEEETTDCYPELLQSIDAFRPTEQTTCPVSETRENDMETNTENVINCLFNASTNVMDKPKVCAMSVCQYLTENYDQSLFSEKPDSEEAAEATEEIYAKAENRVNCLPDLSESDIAFDQRTESPIPVSETLNSTDQHVGLCLQMEDSEDNVGATEETNGNVETIIIADYLSNSPDFVPGGTLDQSDKATCYDITVFEYLNVNEQNLFSETEESEYNEEELTETTAMVESSSQCLSKSLESSNLYDQQKSIVVSSPEFLDNPNHYNYLHTSESEENNEDMHEADANDDHNADCLHDSIDLDAISAGQQPTLDEQNAKYPVQTSAKERNLCSSSPSSSESCGAFPTEKANTISVSEYLEQKDQILSADTDESEGGDESTENISDSLYGLSESFQNDQLSKPAKPVFEQPEENDLPFETREDEEHAGQQNEKEECRQIEKCDEKKSLHLDDTFLRELSHTLQDFCRLSLEYESLQICHQQQTNDSSSTYDYIRRIDETHSRNIRELSENSKAEVGNKQENEETRLLFEHESSTYQPLHSKDSTVTPDIPLGLPESLDSVSVHNQHRIDEEEYTLRFHLNEQSQVTEFYREIDTERREEDWATSKVDRNASCEQNSILSPTSSDLQRKSDELELEHGEEVHEVNETSRDRRNLADQSSSNTSWNCVSQRNAVVEPILAGKRIVTDFSYETGNSCIAKVTAKLQTDHETVAEAVTNVLHSQGHKVTCRKDGQITANAHNDVRDAAFWNDNDRDGAVEQCEKHAASCDSFSDIDNNLLLDNSSFSVPTIASRATNSLSLSADHGRLVFSNSHVASVTSKDEFPLQTGATSSVRIDEGNDDFEEYFVIDDKKRKSANELYTLTRKSFDSGCVIRHNIEAVSPGSKYAQENVNRISVKDQTFCKVFSNVSRSQSLPEMSKYSLCSQGSLSTYLHQPFQETVILLNRKSQNVDKISSEDGQKSDIMDEEVRTESTAFHILRLERSGGEDDNQATTCSCNSSDSTHCIAADESLTSEVGSPVSGDSSVRIPSYETLTVAEYLTQEPGTSDDSVDDDGDSSLSYAPKENPESSMSGRNHVQDDEAFESCQKKDTNDVVRNSETIDNGNNETYDNSNNETDDNSNNETDDNSNNATDDNSNNETDDNSNNVTDDNSNKETDDNSNNETDDNSNKETDDNSNNETDVNSNKETDDNSNNETDDNSNNETDDNSNNVTDDNSNKETDDNSNNETDVNSNKETDDNSNNETDDNSNNKTDDNSNNETEETKDNLHFIKTEDGSDNCVRLTSSDKAEIISERQQKHINITNRQPHRLLLKELPDNRSNRLTQSECDSFIMFAGNLLIVCTALCVIVFRDKLCSRYVFGPPPT